MLSLGTLVLERPCYVFHTHTHKDTQHILGPIGNNTTCHVLTAAICIALNNSNYKIKKIFTCRNCISLY